MIELTFNRLFQSKFEAGFYLVLTKSITHVWIISKSIEINRKEIEIDQKQLKS